MVMESTDICPTHYHMCLKMGSVCRICFSCAVTKIKFLREYIFQVMYGILCGILLCNSNLKLCK